MLSFHKIWLMESVEENEENSFQITTGNLLVIIQFPRALGCFSKKWLCLGGIKSYRFSVGRGNFLSHGEWKYHSRTRNSG